MTNNLLLNKENDLKKEEKNKLYQIVQDRTINQHQFQTSRSR